MGFFSRLFGLRGEGAPREGDAPVEDPPEWASFFVDAATHDTFIAAVEGELRRRGLTFTVGDGTVEAGAPGQLTKTYGLQNLAQLCNQQPAASWPTIVREHFENILKTENESLELERRAASFEGVRHLLKVKLYPATFLRQGAEVTHRLLAEDLCAVLAYDLPSSVMTVKKAHVERWGLPHDALFDEGLENVRREKQPDRSDLPLDGGGAIVGLTGESFFASSHALLVDEHVPVTDYGAIVAIPHRHVVLCHAIEDSRAVMAVNRMIVLAYKLYQQGPGSVSRSIYWWRGGSFTRLPSELSEDGVTFKPPSDFLDVLGRLVERN